MPSPVGHALAGAAAGLALSRVRRVAAPSRPLSDTNKPPRVRDLPGWVPRNVPVFVFICGIVATLPDLDLLAGLHSAQTHSVGAAAIAGAVAAAVARRDRFRVGVITAVAYATHILLDWLGSDGTPPFGVMALWPFSDAYFESDLHIFMAISRRYWLPGFWMYNLQAIVREVLILGPIATVIWWVKRRGTA